METQRQWSDKAIQRTTPLLMGLYSLLTLVAIKMNAAKKLVAHETTTWYDKNGELTFSDIIVITRRAIWSEKYFSKSANDDDLLQLTDQKVNSLIYQLAMAA